MLNQFSLFMMLRSLPQFLPSAHKQSNDPIILPESGAYNERILLLSLFSGEHPWLGDT